MFKMSFRSNRPSSVPSTLESDSADVQHLLEALEPRMLLSADSFTLLALGDSITEGEAGRVGYRRALWFMLQNAGYEVDFLGSQTSNHPSGDFDQDHEGHGGWRADEIINGRSSQPGAGRLGDWLDDYTPDVVLLHIGTNDLNQGQDPTRQAQEVGTIIDLLRADNPNVVVFVAKIIPNESRDYSHDAVIAFNDTLPSLVAAKDTPQSRIILVDQYTGFDVHADTFDLTHPDNSGEQKMAARWFEAIDAYFGNSSNPGGPPPADQFGNSRDTATTIGFVDQPIVIEDRVGDELDGEDWIRFKIGRDTVVRAELSGLSADAHVELWTSRATAGSYNSGTANEFVEQQLAGGYYYLRIFTWDGSPTSYKLTLSALPPGEEPQLPDDPPVEEPPVEEPPVDPPAGDSFGNSRDTATTIGFVDQPIVIDEQIGGGDGEDWIRFKIGRDTVVRADLTGLQGDVNVELWTSRAVVGSYNSGTQNESLERQMAGGYFYLRVYSEDGKLTPYRLTLSALPPGETPQLPPEEPPVEEPPVEEPPGTVFDDLFGNSRDTATTIGFVDEPIVIEERIGDNGDGEDWIRFKIGRDTVVRAELTGLQGDVNVELWTSRSVVGSYNSGTQDELFERQMAGGYYYLRVVSEDGKATPYHLTLSALPPGVQPQSQADASSSDDLPQEEPPDVVPPVEGPLDGDAFGNARSTATTIDPVEEPVVIHEHIGAAGDLEDWIRFKVRRDATIQVVLSNLSANVDVELYTSRPIAGSSQLGTADESFSRLVAGGYYYLRIFAEPGEVTDYTLTLAAPLPGQQQVAGVQLVNQAGQPLLMGA